MDIVNPIIPGFYPDPSVCRVGEDYYLVNSSFEFFPGVPLWHSRDLVNWEQLGHVLTEDSQLSLRSCKNSGGIYAPTIRWHDGRFYMITTNVSCGGNFFVWTDDIRGSWSDPVYVNQKGIDPSLFWDDDGKVYYTGSYYDEEGKGGIIQFELDLQTGESLSEKRIIWRGTGGRSPEGPHMYKVNGLYYLLIAEGGTEYGHMVTIARSRSVWGPFESCPRNPIFTHRDDGDSMFQAVGHGDLVTDTQGNWWMVFHAIRPSVAMLHHLGRETMLVPVSWDEDGWPVVNGGRSVSPVTTVPGDARFETLNSWCDRFEGASLSPRWSWLRNPDRPQYSLSDAGIVLNGSETTLNDVSPSTFLGVRQQKFDICYETCMSLSSKSGCAGMTVYHTAEHHYDLCVRREKSRYSVWLRKRVADILVESEPVFMECSESLLLRIEADRRNYRFLAGRDASHLTCVGTGSSQLLSSECMRCTFTGCFVGIFAEGETESLYRYFSASDPQET